MLRPLPFGFTLILLAGLALLLAPVSIAEEPDENQDYARIATDEEAVEALALFKQEYKARGLKGEDKLLQRDYAMSELARIQHPDIVAALVKIAKGSNQILRTLAVIYLGEQTELPGLAGRPIASVMKRNGKDPVLVISALQSIGHLRYFGAYEQIGGLLHHRDFAVKKAAIQTIGQIGEMRLWKEILKLAGVEVRSGDEVDTGTDKQGSKEEVVEEGYSYEGVEVFYDTGTAGDHDQKMAEKIGKAKLAANKAAAMGKAGSGGGGSGGGGGATGRGGVARDPKELLPFVLHTLWQLTGEQFSNSREVADWVIENRQLIRDRIETLGALEKAQKEEAKAQK